MPHVRVLEEIRITCCGERSTQMLHISKSINETVQVYSVFVVIFLSKCTKILSAKCT